MTIDRNKVLSLYRDKGIHSMKKIAARLSVGNSYGVRAELKRILASADCPVRSIWTEHDQDLLAKLYPDTNAATIARRLHRSLTSVYGMATKLNLHPHTVRGGIKKGQHFYPAGEFKKGLVPFNKGMKNWQKSLPRETQMRIKRGQFKPGQLPWDTLHDGAITIHTDWHDRQARRKYIRIAQGKWELLSRYVWRKHRGRIPKGKCVAFKNIRLLDKDGCPKCVISNLILLTRAENAIHGVQQSDGFIASRMAMKVPKGVKPWTKGRVSIDRQLMRELLKHPNLLEARRQQINLRRRIEHHDKALR